MKREKVICDLLSFECEECPFNKACDTYMYNSGICFCNVLIREIEELEWWEDDEQKKIVTIKDLGFGDDDAPAKYVEVGNKKGYLGTIFGIEGDWKVVIANIYGEETKYTTINVRNLNEIKEIDKYE